MPYKDPIKEKEYQVKYRLTHKAVDKSGRSTSRREKDPIGWMLWRIKSKAKRQGLKFNLDREDIIIPEFCPILNIKLISGRESGIYCSPSLDRIDNSKGYIKGNVKIISQRANTYKSNMSKQDIGKLYEYVFNSDRSN